MCQRNQNANSSNERKHRIRTNHVFRRQTQYRKIKENKRKKERIYKILHTHQTKQTNKHTASAKVHIFFLLKMTSASGLKCCCFFYFPYTVASAMIEKYEH